MKLNSSLAKDVLEIHSDLSYVTHGNHQTGTKIPTGIHPNGKTNMTSILQIALHKDNGIILGGAVATKTSRYEFIIQWENGILEMTFPVLKNITATQAILQMTNEFGRCSSTLKAKIKNKKGQGGGPKSNGFYVKAAAPNRNSAQYALNVVIAGEFEQEFVDYLTAHRFVIQGTGSNRILPAKKVS
jgi:hypothetical protein